MQAGSPLNCLVIAPGSDFKFSRQQLQLDEQPCVPLHVEYILKTSLGSAAAQTCGYLLPTTEDSLEINVHLRHAARPLASTRASSNPHICIICATIMQLAAAQHESQTRMTASSTTEVLI